MNAATAKKLRREMRRTAGLSSIAALEEAQRNIQALANSLALAHSRIDALDARIAELEAVS